MDYTQKVLMIDCYKGFYKMKHYKVGDFYGPVDLGLHMSAKHGTLNIGTGLLAGSIFPGSNRLVVTGFSPCWGGFYISTMGGAGLVFEHLGLNMVSLQGHSPLPSVLYLNRNHGEEVEVEINPIPVNQIWNEGRGGVYSLSEWVLENYADRYENDPRIIATGPSAAASDVGALCSIPLMKGKFTHADTWAGRGGFGSKLYQAHGIAAIVYGGTVIDEDFRDRKVADEWFVAKYEQKLAAKDIEATTKYRYDTRIQSGGTLGVNYSILKGKLLSFNYRSIHWSEEERLALNEKHIANHYLKQFNEETIEKKQQKTCGEPCAAICKKMNGHFKKDYEPYQTMGPLSGIFDQRAAEMLNNKADSLGFDAISIGGVIAWIFECLAEGYITPEEAGVSDVPYFQPDGFDTVEHSMHNAKIGVELLDAFIEKKGLMDLSEGARKLARHLAREKGSQVIDCFVYSAFGRKGWMVPNQYWTTGPLSPMAVVGKYFMYYGNEFYPPRTLGRMNAERLKKELILDNVGMCRFHRGWAEEMLPEIMESLYGLGEDFKRNLKITASRINSRNASQYWKTRRTRDYVHTFLKRKKEVDGVDDPELDDWIRRFDEDSSEAAKDFWYEIHKGISESLREFE